MSQHLCHARDCQTAVPRKMFMCRKHWFMLPKDMQDQVWDTYTPGQENTMDVSAAYMEVTRKCIEYVWKKENP